ncbi:MAG TPA: DUF3795 domain-containing protein [Candidatus Deferrimicrobium sp.]|nr:DUF3795 domain-containing protein [Candidatus Deferrimicrobium sp.]
MTSDKDQLSSVETAVLGKCGVFCGACDAYLGKSKQYAKDLNDNLGIDAQKTRTSAEDLLRIMDQVNYDDGVGCFILGINAKQYQSFKRILKIIAHKPISSEETELEDFKYFQTVLRKYVNSPNCSGCGTGTGAAKACPIAICCNDRGFLTCAECPDIQAHFICKTLNETRIPSMITDNCTYFNLITRRYMHWNVENLKKIFKKGYKQYLEDMKEKCEKGFFSGQVISKDRVFRDLLGF